MNDSPLPETVFVSRIDGMLRVCEHWQFFIKSEGQQPVVAEYQLVGIGSLTTGDGKPRPQLRVVKGLNP